MLKFFLFGKILELDVCFVSKIRGWLKLLELVVPDSSCLSVWQNAGCTNSTEHSSGSESENTRATKKSGIHAGNRVSVTSIIHMNSLELVVPFGCLDQLADMIMLGPDKV